MGLIRVILPGGNFVADSATVLPEGSRRTQPQQKKKQRATDLKTAHGSNNVSNRAAQAPLKLRMQRKGLQLAQLCWPAFVRLDKRVFPSLGKVAIFLNVDRAGSGSIETCRRAL